MQLSWRNPGDLVVCIATAKDTAKQVTIKQGINTLTEEQWSKIKTNKQVKALLESEDLVEGVDLSAQNVEEAKQFSKPITELTSKEARALIPTVTDKSVLEIWNTQEKAKGRRHEILTALRNQLKLVTSQAAA